MSLFLLDWSINEKLTLDVGVGLVVRGPHTIEVNHLMVSLKVSLPEREGLTDLEPVDVHALLQTLGCHQVVLVVLGDMHRALDEKVSLIPVKICHILGLIGDILWGVDGRIQESHELHILLREFFFQVLGVWDHFRVELEVGLIAQVGLIKVNSLQGEALLSIKLDSFQEIQLVVSIRLLGVVGSLRGFLPAEGPEGREVRLAEVTMEILHDFLC